MRKVAIREVLETYIGGGWGTELPDTEHTEQAWVIRGADFPNVRVGRVSEAPRRYHTATNLRTRRLDVGDLIFEVSGGTKGRPVGRTVLVTEGLRRSFDGEVICASFCKKLRPSRTHVNPAYLFWALQYLYEIGVVEQYQVQSTGISNFQFESFIEEELLPLPPLPLQERIAVVLSRYDALIVNNTRRIQILEEMARTVHREWFVEFRCPGHQDALMVDSKNLGPIPAGWDVRHLGELCELVKQPFSPREHSDLPLLDMARMQRGTLAVNEVGDPDELSSSRTVFEENDVLFGSIRPYLHKVALAPFRGVTNTSVLTIRARDHGLQAFLAVFLSSTAVVAWADQHATGTKMPVIKWSALEQMPVVVPDKTALGRFSEATAPLLAFLKLGYAWNRNLMSTRNLLLSRLMSGEVDVSQLAIDTSELVA